MIRSFSFVLRPLGLLIGGLLLNLPAGWAQSWQWVQQTRSGVLGGAASGEASTLVVDAQGDSYVGGTYRDSVRFGSTLLVTPPIVPGGSDNGAAFITKLAAAGQWSWTTTSTGPGASYGRVLSAAPGGGALIAGEFSGTIHFGATTLINPPTPPGSYPRRKSFIAQVSATGQWQWAVATALRVDIRSIAADGAGNVVVVGVLRDSATFGTTYLVPRGFADAFVAKLTPAGQWLWALQTGVASLGVATGVTLDAAGTAYVTGTYAGTARFGALALPNASAGAYGFLAALSPGGTAQWVAAIPSTEFCIPTTLRVEPVSGDLLVGGWLAVGATFGPTVLTADSVADAFVARFDPAGRAWRWATIIGGSPGREESVTALATDVTGAAVYVAGQFGGPADTGSALLPPATATFGTQALTGFGAADGFVARLNGNTGQWQNAIAWGGPSDDYGGGLDVLPGTGDVTISGAFVGRTASVGGTTLTGNPNNPYPVEAMIARLELRPLGLNTPADDVNATLAPNPAHHTTRLTLTPAPTARPLTLLDAVGRAVRTATLPANQSDLTLDLRGLSAGLYVVRVGGLTRRLVVE